MITQWYQPFFRPQGIAVVGVSSSPEKLGYGVARNLVASGYPGAINFVGRNPGRVFDRTIASDLDQVPDPLDLAVLIVPGTSMPSALEACGRRGIKAAILLSGGFREVGPEGAALEAECLRIARAHGMRLIGPNCIGILDTHLPLDTTFLQSPLPVPGGIAMVSHSGALCAAIVDWARGESFGFSKLVSLGNQIDINETDVLQALADDDETRVIVAYLETVSDGRRFVEVARRVSRRKPVIALKGGRLESGQRAASSHTGAMAASDTAFDAAFAKAGVLRADTTEQVFDWARALDGCPLPAGNAVAVLTDAGGLGVLAADALESHGLSLAHLSENTAQGLRNILPPAASVHNPVDLLASASPEGYARCLELLLADAEVSMAMVILVPPPMYSGESVAEALIPVIQDAQKPVVVVLAGSVLIAGALVRFKAAGIITYAFPERAASALGVLAQRAAEARTSQAEEWRRPTHLPAATEADSAQDLLAAYGIPAAPARLARTRLEAAAIARELGFPVVMKAAAASIVHKSDIGGVLLDLESEEAVLAGYENLSQRASAVVAEGALDGILVQRQVRGGQEVIVGAVRDPLFGPLIMFGSGGVEAEGLRDTAFALGPLGEDEAEDLLRRTWAGRKLDGFRNIPAADKAAVVDILVKISWMAEDNSRIEEFEINPLLVLADGAVAVDARVKFRVEEQASTTQDAKVA